MQEMALVEVKTRKVLLRPGIKVTIEDKIKT